MILEEVREWCKLLPHATEDIKWEGDLVFSIGRKMFAAIMLDPPHRVSFKCSAEDFAELTERPGIIPAPYLARASWVSLENGDAGMSRRELRERLTASYDMVRSRLPRKIRDALM